MKKTLLLLLCIVCSTTLFAQRNSEWAAPISSSNVENLYKVDDGVYRCGQPNTSAFKELEGMGVKEVLNLRSFHDDKEEASATSLILYQVKMKASDSDWDEAVKALSIIKNRQGAIAIHCMHGSDRTGLIIALYRLVFQNWTKDEAIDELKNGGYGYHKVYSNIISFIRNVDVEKLKESI